MRRQEPTSSFLLMEWNTADVSRWDVWGTIFRGHLCTMISGRKPVFEREKWNRAELGLHERQESPQRYQTRLYRWRTDNHRGKHDKRSRYRGRRAPKPNTDQPRGRGSPTKRTCWEFPEGVNMKRTPSAVKSSLTFLRHGGRGRKKQEVQEQKQGRMFSECQ